MRLYLCLHERLLLIRSLRPYVSIELDQKATALLLICRKTHKQNEFALLFLESFSSKLMLTIFYTDRVLLLLFNHPMGQKDTWRYFSSRFKSNLSWNVLTSCSQFRAPLGKQRISPDGWKTPSHHLTNVFNSVLCRRRCSHSEDVWEASFTDVRVISVCSCQFRGQTAHP